MVRYPRQSSTKSRTTSTSTMDIDHQNQRSKYSHHQQQHHYHHPGQSSSSASKPNYESRGSRSNRGDPTHMDQHERPRSRSSSNRQRGGDRRGGSSSRYSSSSQQQQYNTSSQQQQYQHHPSSRQGPTNAPPSSMMTQQPNQQHFTPPPSNHYHGGSSSQHRHSHHGAPHTPENSMQPTFPPPAVTSESPPSSEQSQRRPAYLLHRDLVIGKGSYGQVCIASRGEAEGHMSSGTHRSGKRKKFACKCVMLRNDPKYISKLQEEVNVLRELRGHDNVIRLYDVFCVDNELFIITELGRGGDLFHLLTTHPKHGVTESYAGKYLFCFDCFLGNTLSCLFRFILFHESFI